MNRLLTLLGFVAVVASGSGGAAHALQAPSFQSIPASTSTSVITATSALSESAQGQGALVRSEQNIVIMGVSFNPAELDAAFSVDFDIIDDPTPKPLAEVLKVSEHFLSIFWANAGALKRATNKNEILLEFFKFYIAKVEEEQRDADSDEEQDGDITSSDDEADEGESENSSDEEKE